MERFGNFTVGNKTGPYTGSLEIVITGTRSSNRGFIFGNTNNNKVIAVSGGMDMRTDVGSHRARLLQTVAPGSTTISSSEVTGWQVGDKLAILSSSFSASESEERIISAISGSIITLDSALQY